MRLGPHRAGGHTVTAPNPIRVATIAVAALLAPYAQAQPRDTMAQRLQPCVVCHGAEGRATNAGYFPRIAGKPAAYLENQLQNFKTGRRRNAAMSHLLQHLSDDYLREIAAHFAALDLPYAPPTPIAVTPDERRQAETLVFVGAPGRGLPACAACHGRTMAGMLPATPGLATLPADYVVAQLGAWRTGARRATAPDCMADVARRMTPGEIGAVARWFATQALPAGTRADPVPGTPLPLACGGVPR
jgi:cytochrome c553